MSNALRLSLIVTAFLAGCTEADPAANAAANSTDAAAASDAEQVANAAAPAATPAPATAAGGVTADYMVGKWSAMGEDCKDTLDFRKDGTVVTPFGNAKWTLNGDKLAVDFGDGSSNLDPTTIKALGPDRIEITKASGKKESQKRC